MSDSTRRRSQRILNRGFREPHPSEVSNPTMRSSSQTTTRGTGSGISIGGNTAFDQGSSTGRTTSNQPEKASVPQPLPLTRVSDRVRRRTVQFADVSPTASSRNTLNDGFYDPRPSQLTDPSVRSSSPSRIDQLRQFLQQTGSLPSRSESRVSSVSTANIAFDQGSANSGESRQDVRRSRRRIVRKRFANFSLRHTICACAQARVCYRVRNPPYLHHFHGESLPESAQMREPRNLSVQEMAQKGILRCSYEYYNHLRAEILVTDDDGTSQQPRGSARGDNKRKSPQEPSMSYEGPKPKHSTHETPEDAKPEAFTSVKPPTSSGNQSIRAPMNEPSYERIQALVRDVYARRKSGAVNDDLTVSLDGFRMVMFSRSPATALQILTASDYLRIRGRSLSQRDQQDARLFQQLARIIREERPMQLISDVFFLICRVGDQEYRRLEDQFIQIFLMNEEA